MTLHVAIERYTVREIRVGESSDGHPSICSVVLDFAFPHYPYHCTSMSFTYAVAKVFNAHKVRAFLSGPQPPVAISGARPFPRQRGQWPPSPARSPHVRNLKFSANPTFSRLRCAYVHKFKLMTHRTGIG